MTEQTTSKSPFDEVRDWLHEHNARRLWTADEFEHFMLYAYALRGEVIIVQLFNACLARSESTQPSWIRS